MHKVVYPPPYGNIDKNHYGYVKMANGVKLKIYQKDNVIIEDEVGNSLELNNRRVVDGITTHIISLTQLMREGWTMKRAKKRILLSFTRVRTVRD